MNQLDNDIENRIIKLITAAIQEPCSRHDPDIACSTRIEQAAVEIANCFIRVGSYHRDIGVASLDDETHGDGWEPVFVFNM